MKNEGFKITTMAKSVNNAMKKIESLNHRTDTLYRRASTSNVYIKHQANEIYRKTLQNQTVIYRLCFP